MSETIQGEAPGAEQEAAQAQAGSEAQASEQKPAESASTDPWAGLPEEFAWVKDKVAESNSEAAKYRTQRNEAREQLAQAKTLEEFEAAREAFEKQQAALELELTRERAARTHGLTPEDLGLLDGITDPEVLNERAKKLAERLAQAQSDPAPPVPRELRGGRGNESPSDNPSDEDGAALWRKHRAKSRH